jgi:hypothetical protein
MKLELASTTTIADSGVEISKHLWYAQSEDFAVAAEGETPTEAAANLRDALCKFLTGPTR